MTNKVSRRRVLFAGLVGNVLEWYDFTIYGFMAPILAPLFFPDANPVLSLIGVYGAFAAGFLMRPFGGIVIGHIADRVGRKRALIISIALMAIPTFAIGLLPTSATLGVAAAVLMVLLRMLQGFAVGGELSSSIVFLVEKAPRNRRGFFSSFTYLGVNVGVFLGSVVALVASFLLSAEQLSAWGWRIPFLLGILVAVIGLYVRLRVVDDAQPRKKVEKETFPIVTAFQKYWRQMIYVMGLNLIFATGLYTIFIYIASWLVSRVDIPRTEALEINTVNILLLALLLPAFGRLADRFGHKKILLGGAAGMALFSWPLLWLMHHPSALLILLGQAGFAVLLAAYIAPLPVAMSKLFPHDVRVSPVGIAYNAVFAIFGGTAPLVAVWLIARSGDVLAFAWYLSAMAVLSLIAVILLPAKSYLDKD